MNIKTMRRDDWHRILEKKIVIEDIEYGEFRGKVSLLKILKITEPLYVDYGDRRAKIVDVNHSWVQIAFENQFFWMTAMFDENDQFFDVYVDMTDGNHVDVGNPYFADMYLDYVIYGDTVQELDRDELESALRNGEITQAQYDRVISESGKVFAYLEENKEALKELVQRKFRELKGKVGE